MPKAVSPEEGVLFLSAKDLLDDGTINYTRDVKYISEDDFTRLSRKALPQRNDIIYSRIGAALGKARVVESDIRFLVSYSCCTIRPIDVDAYYLRYERMYVDKYNWIVNNRTDENLKGLLDLNPRNQYFYNTNEVYNQKKFNIWKIMMSVTLKYFYGVLLIGSIFVYVML